MTIENDINLAALGEQWRGIARGVDDFVFLSIGTGLGAGLVLRGELHRGQNGAAGELDYARVGLAEDIDPCADAVCELTRELPAAAHPLEPPYDPRSIFAAARAGDRVARRVVEEECAPDRPARRPARGRHRRRARRARRRYRRERRPALRRHPALLARLAADPPRVEASSLGDAAVLTGALAVGRRAARENVFVHRRARD